MNQLEQQKQGFIEKLSKNCQKEKKEKFSGFKIPVNQWSWADRSESHEWILVLCPRNNDKQQRHSSISFSPSTFPSRRWCVTPFQNDNSHYYSHPNPKTSIIFTCYLENPLCHRCHLLLLFTVSKCRYPKILYDNIHVHNWGVLLLMMHFQRGSGLVYFFFFCFPDPYAHLVFFLLLLIFNDKWIWLHLSHYFIDFQRWYS